MKNIFTLLLVSLFLISCSSDNPQHQEQEKLWDEMMVIHDEVMPKMSQIRKVSKLLTEFGQENRESLDGNTLERLSLAIGNLNKAGDGMMTWMQGINDKKPSKLRDEKSHEEIVQVLNTETKKIEKVKENMLSSIQKGKDLMIELEVN